MTGEQIVTQALALLNYTDGEGHPQMQGSSRLRKRALFVVNQIYRELWHTEKTAPYEALLWLTQETDLSDRATEAFPYGVAMLLAQGEGDGDSYTVFQSLYCQKRASLTSVSARQDVLPCPEG